MIKLNKNDVLLLLKNGVKKEISLEELYLVDFNNQSYRVCAAHYIFALSFQLKMTSKTYQNLIQFFILSLNDCVSNNNETTNFTAFQYAVQYLIDPINENHIKDTFKTTTNEMVAEFFSRIKVLSDWTSYTGSSIKIEEKSLQELSLNLLETHTHKIKKLIYPFKQINNIVPDFKTTVDKISKAILPKKVEDIIDNLSASQYYLSLLKDLKPTQECCDFFCLVLEEWGNIDNKEIKIKLSNTVNFLKQDKINNLQLTIYTDDLFNKHIPQLISYIEALKKNGNFEEQIKLVENYLDKINLTYAEQLNFKMDVYKKFLEEKLSNF